MYGEAAGGDDFLAGVLEDHTAMAWGFGKKADDDLVDFGFRLGIIGRGEVLHAADWPPFDGVAGFRYRSPTVSN
jgi:hypothetical protein